MGKETFYLFQYWNREKRPKSTCSVLWPVRKTEVNTGLRLIKVRNILYLRAFDQKHYNYYNILLRRTIKMLRCVLRFEELDIKWFPHLVRQKSQGAFISLARSPFIFIKVLQMSSSFNIKSYTYTLTCTHSK